MFDFDFTECLQELDGYKKNEINHEINLLVKKNKFKILDRLYDTCILIIKSTSFFYEKEEAEFKKSVIEKTYFSLPSSKLSYKKNKKRILNFF